MYTQRYGRMSVTREEPQATKQSPHIVRIDYRVACGSSRVTKKSTVLFLCGEHHFPPRISATSFASKSLIIKKISSILLEMYEYS